ncbi:MAG: vanadium-dependent haloperoxidase [Bacteroidetes bacterium]|nr:vanadium-dependent haloperoxidase [Bacteroidota bacterium]
MKRFCQSLFIFLSISIIVLSCDSVNPNFQEDASNPEFLHRSMKQLTDVIVHDIFSPPVASRIYAYPSIAAYEVIQYDYPEYVSLAGQLHELETVPQPKPDEEYCFPLAGVHAFLTVGKALIFSENQIEEFEDHIYAEFQEIKIPKDVYKRSMEYGKLVSDHILEWAANDKYKETRTYPKYSISEDPAKWKPTPPDYMDGIEPHWKEIRTFVLDSAEQFVPTPPTEFDMSENSLFYKELMEVYNALDAEDKEERIAIAKFWDCNPYVSHHVGHVMTATKKITPGGHWVGITDLACRKTEANMMKTAEAYASVSIALADAFISCWDEKYRSNLLRPETVINQFLDEEWLPALQTPPFPEYTSGHSVISRAAAITLTHIFGDNFAFDDNVEVEYGLPVRSFDSFIQASEEAAVSRLYGGIHYRPAIDNGVDQGQKVGEFIVSKLKMK